MRVTTVREDIESFLQDDDDMMKLCLTRKKELEQVQQQQLQQQQSRTDGQLHNHLAHRRHSIKPMLSWSVLVCSMTGPPKNLSHCVEDDVQTSLPREDRLKSYSGAMQ